MPKELWRLSRLPSSDSSNAAVHCHAGSLFGGQTLYLHLTALGLDLLFYSCMCMWFGGDGGAAQRAIAEFRGDARNFSLQTVS